MKLINEGEKETKKDIIKQGDLFKQNKETEIKQSKEI